MLLISWNVNGIRAALRKGFLDFLARYKPDVLCLQEIKADDHPPDLKLPASYNVYWNPARNKRGYAGTAIFSKIKPSSAAQFGMGIPEHDREGRVIRLECPDFHLVNVYTPNSKRDLSRLEYRQRWDADFLKMLEKLEKTKPVIFCGDLNVAHEEIDLTYPKANRRNHGFTDEERAGFGHLVKAGFLDTFREFHKDGGHYTWWSQMGDCRKRNIGWRIDYFCISKSLKPRLKSARILNEVMGSDHCPVAVTIGEK